MMLSAAVILLAYSISLFTPTNIAINIERMLANAAIGVSLGVEPNPYNTLAAELQQMETDLNDRERRILALESDLRASRAFETYLSFGSLALSAFLFMLVGFNFYLDRKRVASRDQPQRSFAVDLRN